MGDRGSSACRRNNRLTLEIAADPKHLGLASACWRCCTQEFLRLFLLHVLPDRFVRIHYYGLLANRHREQALAVCREVLPGPPSRPQPLKTDWRERFQRLTGIDLERCEV